MNKILLGLFVCLFTLNAFACGGSKDKEEEDKKLFEQVSTLTH